MNDIKELQETITNLEKEKFNVENIVEVVDNE